MSINDKTCPALVKTERAIYFMIFQCSLNSQSDALSRRADFRPRDDPLPHQLQTILNPTSLQFLATQVVPSFKLNDQIQKALMKDKFAQDLIQDPPEQLANKGFSYLNGLLNFKNLIYVPDGPLRIQVLQLESFVRSPNQVNLTRQSFKSPLWCKENSGTRLQGILVAKTIFFY
jgi:hypothetical protein